MVVADGQGVPIGLHVASVRLHESQLAEATLATVRVPQARGRPISTGPSYRQRWKVERCFGWMDNYRRLVVRYERAVEHDKTFCLIAIILWYVQPILKYLVIKPISAIVHTSS